MQVYQVLPVESNRLDLFIARTMSSYSVEFKKYVLYYNPGIDPLRVKAGDKIKIPSKADMDAIPSLRFYIFGLLRL